MILKTIINTSLFCLLVAPSFPQALQNGKLVVYFFGSRTCSECLEIKEEILKPLAAEYPELISLQLHEIEDKESFRLMMEMEKRYGVLQPFPQELFLSDAYLAGEEAIRESAEALIREYLAHPEKWKIPDSPPGKTEYEGTLNARWKHFTLAGILIAGLIDGVNPCALATMIFLISFLATRKRNRTEVIIIGMAFTAAVYLTYLLLGLGAFRAITALRRYQILTAVIRWTAAGLAGIVALISFWDALSYRRSHETKDIKLQLPRSIKLRMHKLIAGNLKGSHIIFGAIVTGFLVTLLEAVCTGQVYLPTIILMTQSTGLKLKGWIYLLFYNFLFVLPLLIIMILAYLGLTWHTLARVTQKHVAFLKILLGLVMIILAVFLVIV